MHIRRWSPQHIGRRIKVGTCWYAAYKVQKLTQMRVTKKTKATKIQMASCQFFLACKPIFWARVAVGPRDFGPNSWHKKPLFPTLETSSAHSNQVYSRYLGYNSFFVPHKLFVSLSILLHYYIFVFFSSFSLFYYSLPHSFLMEQISVFKSIILTYTVYNWDLLISFINFTVNLLVCAFIPILIWARKSVTESDNSV